jgi:hypothetical protein
VANISKPGEEEWLGRRAEYKTHPETKRHKQDVVSLCKKEGREKRARGRQQRCSYTLRKRRRACARALPDVATAVSRYALAVG